MSFGAGIQVTVLGEIRESEVYTMKKQQSDGVDAHSLTVDPLFVDPENGDFRLKPNSPTLKLGFVPFDMSKVGLCTTKQ